MAKAASGGIFTISTKHEYSGHTEVCAFECECKGAMAKVADKNAIVGRNAKIVGRISQRLWKDDEGRQHSKNVVVVEKVEFAKQ